jgi:hypothetical protein
MNITSSPSNSNRNPSARYIKAMVPEKNITACGYYAWLLGANSTIVATECTLGLGVMSMTAKVKDGLYSEEIHDSWPVNNTFTSGQNINISPPWGPDKGLEPGQRFGIDTELWNSMLRPDSDPSGVFSLDFLPNQILQGSMTTSDSHCGIITDRGNPTILESLFFPRYNNTMCENPTDPFACAFKAITKSLTKSIRDSDMLVNGTSAKNMVVGDTFASAVIIKVDYRWMALPITVWLLSIAVVVGAWWKTRSIGLPLWREDLVPLVFLMRENTETAQYWNTSMEEVEKSKRLRVQLQKYQDQLSFTPGGDKEGFQRLVN